jgi:hypothetical protein
MLHAVGQALGLRGPRRPALLVRRLLEGSVIATFTNPQRLEFCSGMSDLKNRQHP